MAHVHAGIWIMDLAIFKFRMSLLAELILKLNFSFAVKYNIYILFLSFLFVFPFTVDSNRAAAFLNLVKLNKALVDAETTIKLKPQWEKVYRYSPSIHLFFLFHQAFNLE